MRRGAPMNSSKERAVIADDMESGGLSNSSNHSSTSSLGNSGHMSVNLGTDYSSAYSGDKGKKNKSPSYININTLSVPQLTLNASMRSALFIVCGVLFIFSFILPLEYKILLLVFGSCVFGAIASLFLSQTVLSCDDGTPEMRAVSDPIREGADGFLKVQYSVSTVVNDSLFK